MNMYREVEPTRFFSAVVERMVVEKRVPEWLRKADVQVFDDACMTVTFAMEKKFLVHETVEETINITIPTTWFEHWKRDHAPQWFLKRWPVKYSTTLVPKTVRKCCPHLDVPDRESHVCFLQRGF